MAERVPVTPWTSNVPLFVTLQRNTRAYALRTGALHMLFSKDKKFRKPRPNPDDVLSSPVRPLKSTSVTPLLGQTDTPFPSQTTPPRAAGECEDRAGGLPPSRRVGVE